MNLLSAALLLLTLSANHMVFAHGDETPKAKPAMKPMSMEEKTFGHTGDPAKVSRTIKVEMADTMRFTPSEIIIKRGETVRIAPTNSGKILHEIVLGTMQELKAHAALMKKFPGMEHDEPHMAHVAPGKTEGIVWQFTKSGEFYYACLIPGHFEAGMFGKVIVK